MELFFTRIYLLVVFDNCQTFAFFDILKLFVNHQLCKSFQLGSVFRVKAIAAYFLRLRPSIFYLDIILWGDVDDFLEVIDTSYIYSILYLAIPFLILIHIIAAQMKALKLVLGTLNLSDYFHDPAEVIFVFRLPNAETFKRKLFQSLWKDLKNQSVEFNPSRLPFRDKWFFDIQVCLHCW